MILLGSQECLLVQAVCLSSGKISWLHLPPPTPPLIYAPRKAGDTDATVRVALCTGAMQTKLFTGIEASVEASAETGRIMSWLAGPPQLTSPGRRGLKWK